MWYILYTVQCPVSLAATAVSTVAVNGVITSGTQQPSGKCEVYSVTRTMYRVQSTVYRVQSTVQNRWSTVYSLQCSVKCVIYSVQ